MKCMWIGSKNEGCSHDQVPGRSYCTEHLWRVYQKGTAVTRRKDKRTAQAVWDIESEFNAAVEELEQEGWDFARVD